MRRNYITPEYKHTNVEGTLNMGEQKSIFGSKMMDIEDIIILDKRDVVYYQNILNEQLDIIQELLLPPIIHSISDDKKTNHVLKLDESQSSFEKGKNTKWLLDINVRNVLVNYIFSRIKEARTFDGVKNESTISNKVDTAIRNYIEVNLLSRYKFDSIVLYIKYNELKNSGFFRYTNTWNINIAEDINELSKLDINLNFDKSKLIGGFTQEKVATDYNFDYYFDIKYTRE